MALWLFLWMPVIGGYTMEVPSGGTVTLRQGLYNGKDMKQELEGKTLHIELVFVCFFFSGKDAYISTFMNMFFV